MQDPRCHLVVCPRSPRMPIGCQRLAGHPTQIGNMPPVAPKPLGSSLRKELKLLQQSGDKKAPALRCFFVLWVWLGQKGPVLCCGEERALPSRGDRGRGNGYVKEASLAWGPACAHPLQCPHGTYPGGQALLAVQADSTLIGDLGEVLILKLLEADVVGEPGGSGDGAVTYCTGGGQEGARWHAACRQGAAPPALGEALPVFTGEKDWERDSFWRGWVCPH